jgi:Domain of unknown function (DUF4282)
MKESGFFGSLFDFSFMNVVTPRLVKVIYILVMIFTGLAAVGLIVGMAKVNAGLGIVALVVVAPLYFLVTVSLWRMLLEVLTAIVKMEKHLATLASTVPEPPISSPMA